MCLCFAHHSFLHLKSSLEENCPSFLKQLYSDNSLKMYLLLFFLVVFNTMKSASPRPLLHCFSLPNYAYHSSFLFLGKISLLGKFAFLFKYIFPKIHMWECLGKKFFCFSFLHLFFGMNNNEIVLSLFLKCILVQFYLSVICPSEF